MVTLPLPVPVKSASIAALPSPTWTPFTPFPYLLNVPELFSLALVIVGLLAVIVNPGFNGSAVNVTVAPPPPPPAPLPPKLPLRISRFPPIVHGRPETGEHAGTVADDDRNKGDAG